MPARLYCPRCHVQWPLSEMSGECAVEAARLFWIWHGDNCGNARLVRGVGWLPSDDYIRFTAYDPGDSEYGDLLPYTVRFHGHGEWAAYLQHKWFWWVKQFVIGDVHRGTTHVELYRGTLKGACAAAVEHWTGIRDRRRA